jgi:hypothetical protein
VLNIITLKSEIDEEWSSLVCQIEMIFWNAGMSFFKLALFNYQQYNCSSNHLLFSRSTDYIADIEKSASLKYDIPEDHFHLTHHQGRPVLRVIIIFNTAPGFIAI